MPFPSVSSPPFTGLTSPVTTDPLTFSGALTFSKQVAVNNATSHSIFTGTTAAQKVVVVKGAASQSGNLFEVQNSAGTLLGGFDSAGKLFIGSASTSLYELSSGVLQTDGALTVAGRLSATTRVDVSNNAKPNYTMNSGGSDFAIIQNDTSDVWSIGHGSSNTALTTHKLITWARPDKLAFYGATPVVQAAALTQTYATASRTHANPTAAAVATTAATNVAPYGFTQAQADALVAAVNALIVDDANTKQFLNTIADDLQAYGLEQ